MDFSNVWWQANAGDPEPPTVIGNSLRFRGQQFLRKEQGMPTGDWTVSMWIKYAQQNTAAGLISSNTGANDAYTIQGSTTLTLRSRVAGGWGNQLSDGKFVDPSAWYHLVFQNSGGTTQAFINGVQQANTSITFAVSDSVSIGAANSNVPDEPFTGHIAYIHVIDGQVLEPTAFAHTFQGTWAPREIDFNGVYGDRGFFLDFSDLADLGKDRSGNDNDFTLNNFDLDPASINFDWMKDSPSQNFAVMNTRYQGASATNGGLTTTALKTKPSIIGVAGNVGVDGVSTAWDGTEDGWTTSSGTINFGQQPNGFDEISSRTMPAVAIPDSKTQHEVVLADGANILADAQAVFDTGLWIIKSRTDSNQMQFVDSTNGTANVLRSTARDVVPYAVPTGDCVAWCWNAADTTGGFSISDGNHGLGQAPQFVIDRDLNVFHHLMPDGQGMNLASDARSAAQTWTVNETTVEGPGGGTYYSWIEIPGYSKFGFYHGNDLADGPFQYTGFRPSFFLVKAYNQGFKWYIWDTARNTFNTAIRTLSTSNVTTEAGASSPPQKMDIMSNGFKVIDDSQVNQGAGLVIYAAFAEHPFGGSNVIPAPAR